MIYNLLEVDVIAILDEHAVGYKVILHTGVDLYDVATLSTNIQILDLDTLKIRWPRTNSKGVGSTEKKSKLI